MEYIASLNTREWAQDRHLCRSDEMDLSVNVYLCENDFNFSVW